MSLLNNSSLYLGIKVILLLFFILTSQLTNNLDDLLQEMRCEGVLFSSILNLFLKSFKDFGHERSKDIVFE
jgi:hypothetical protein